MLDESRRRITGASPAEIAAARPGRGDSPAGRAASDERGKGGASAQGRAGGDQVGARVRSASSMSRSQVAARSAGAAMYRKSSRYPVLRRARGGGTRPRLSGQGCAAAGSAGAAASAVAAGAAAAAAAKSQGSSVSPRSAAITAAARYWAGSRRCSLAVSRIV
jgi:hypothetical protein